MLEPIVKRLSGGHGADAVFLSAAADNNGPLELGLALARDRAKIVVVGKTKADMPYNESFRKEVELLFTRSYGPGRYDPTYEEKGVDYPIGYVRWTEGRNLSSFLDLIAKGLIDLSPVISAIKPFAEAEQVYADLTAGALPGLGTLFKYDEAATLAARPRPVERTLGKGEVVRDTVRLGVIGAGNYASAMLLPALRDDAKVDLVEVATGTALSGANAQKKFGFDHASTDYHALLARDDIDTVLIATRHAAHAAMTIDALRAGKQVFVEKPLTISDEQTDAVEAAVAETGHGRIMVGFNRRFSKIMEDLKATITEPKQPLSMVYRVQAGQVDPTSWLMDEGQGTRFIGEAGHFLDVFAYLTGASPVSVAAQVLRPANPTRDDFENISAVVAYSDGSVGTLVYQTQGAATLPKEWLEVSSGGRTARMNNFESLETFDGRKAKTRKGYGGAKGQKEMLAAFRDACLSGGDMPIGLDCLLDTTRATNAADRAVKTGQVVRL